MSETTLRVYNSERYNFFRVSLGNDRASFVNLENFQQTKKRFLGKMFLSEANHLRHAAGQIMPLIK